MAAGSEIIVLVCLIMFFGVVYGYYTVKGSGIAERPYNKIYGGAPGAHGPSNVSGKDDRIVMRDWSRGTR
jgi:hypothetical protein